MPKIKVDDIELYYDVVGTGDHVVLCLPGYLGTSDMDFGKFVAKGNKEKFTFVLWDPPGYGQSVPPERDFSPGWLERDSVLVGKLMESLGYKRYSIFGWSQGGVTGMYLTVAKPQTVNKLVTLGTEARFTSHSVRFYEAVSRIDFMPKQKLDPLLKHYSRDYLQRMAKDMAETCSWYLANEGGNYMKGLPSKITRPMLIVHSEMDTTSLVEQAHDLKEQIEHAGMRLFEGGKHDLHLTHTNYFMPGFEEFLLS